MENLSVCSIDNAESVSAVSETLDSKMEITEERKSKRLSPEQKEQIKQLKLSGMGTEEIAKTVGCSKTTVQTTLNGGTKVLSAADKLASDIEKQKKKEQEHQKELLRQIELVKSLAFKKQELKTEQDKTAELERQLAALMSA